VPSAIGGGSPSGCYEKSVYDNSNIINNLQNQIDFYSLLTI